MTQKTESGDARERETSDEPRAPAPRKRTTRAVAAAEETADNGEMNAPTEQVGDLPRVETEEERWRRIALNAYYRAERRGFAPGNELDDWLAAEQQDD